jgi:ABC-2 type transport system ATP-binding protein
MEKVLEIDNITKLYKNNRGIRDISLDIYKGDVFGFLGPNGAGKTSAMKIITGLMKPDSGDVRIFGHSIKNEYEKAMSKVGAIVETAESFQYLTAYENLKIASRYYNIDSKTRIDEVLGLTGLLKYKNEKVEKFSLGMKQRLGIAAALISEPELVILDEPLNGLDVNGMVDMRNIIKTLAQEKQVTFFISSHLIHDIELTCNRVGIIYEGRLLKVDSMEDVLEDFSSLENYFISEVNTNE